MKLNKTTKSNQSRNSDTIDSDLDLLLTPCYKTKHPGKANHQPPSQKMQIINRKKQPHYEKEGINSGNTHDFL